MGHNDEASSLGLDREFSSVELAVAILRRRVLAISVLVACLCVGVIIAFVVPSHQIHTHSACLEIGSQVIGDRVQVFESPDTVAAKLRYSIIPTILERYKEAHPNDERSYAMTVRTPSRSEVVVVETKGTEEQSKILADLLGQVVRDLMADHSRIYDFVKEELESGLQETRMELSGDPPATLQDGDPWTSLLHHQVRLANLQKTREVSPILHSQYDDGAEPVTILLVFVLLGLVAGVFAVMSVEYIGKVRSRYAATERRG